MLLVSQALRKVFALPILMLRIRSLYETFSLLVSSPPCSSQLLSLSYNLVVFFTSVFSVLFSLSDFVTYPLDPDPTLGHDVSLRLDRLVISTSQIIILPRLLNPLIPTPGPAHFSLPGSPQSCYHFFDRFL